MGWDSVTTDRMFLIPDWIGVIPVLVCVILVIWDWTIVILSRTAEVLDRMCLFFVFRNRIWESLDRRSVILLIPDRIF